MAASYYKLIEMRESLPDHLKQKFSIDDVRRLSLSLEDGSVFDIIKELEEIQQLTENSLLKSRIKVVNEHKKQKGDLSRRQNKELGGAKPEEIFLIKAHHESEMRELEEKLEKEIRSTDQKIILELDQQIVSQQTTLQIAEVPLFHVTNDPIDIELQSTLLQFIQRLNSM